MQAYQDKVPKFSQVGLVNLSTLRYFKPTY